LDHHFVSWAGIIRIEDPDAVRDQQSALERGAASGENPEEVAATSMAGPSDELI
jgi:hypothetical protein